MSNANAVFASVVAVQFATTGDSIAYYGWCRTANGKGVTIPSQLRYIDYFAQCMHEGSLRQYVPLQSFIHCSLCL